MAQESGIRTPCCDVEPTLTVQLSVGIPMRFFRRVTKAALRSKDVIIEAVNWERAMYQCPGCKYVWAPGEEWTMYEKLRPRVGSCD